MTKRWALFEPFGRLPVWMPLSVGVLVWVLLLTIWAIGTGSGWIDPLFLPSPGRVFDALIKYAGDGSLFVNIWASLQVVLIGFLLSSLLAVPIGLYMGGYPIVRAVTEPIVNFVRYLPVTSFVPLFILWIGIDIEERIAVIIFGTFFAQLVMVSAAAQAVPIDLINAAYTLGTKRSQCVWHIVFPASLAAIIDALRVTMGWAWTYLVVAELVAADSGLGYISMKAMRGFQVEVIFLAIAVIGLLGLLTDRLFRLAARFLLPWTQ